MRKYKDEKKGVVSAVFSGTLKKYSEQFNVTEEEMDEVAQVILYYADHFAERVREIGELPALLNFYEGLDLMIDKSRDKTPKAMCKKGCHFCCHINVDACQAEVDLLLSYIREFNIKIDIEALKKQQDLGEMERMASADSKCVFLSDKGLCKVYEARPVNCRKYFVASDPKWCNGKENPYHGVQSVLDLHVESLASAIWTVMGEPKKMEALLLGALNKPENKDLVL